MKYIRNDSNVRSQPQFLLRLMYGPRMTGGCISMATAQKLFSIYHDWIECRSSARYAVMQLNCSDG